MGRSDDQEAQNGVDLLQMAFPLRLPAHAAPTLCACHSRSRGSGYLCPRCGVKVCDVPTDCPVCGITIVMSTHLARSYHHLFPVTNWKAVPWDAEHGPHPSLSLIQNHMTRLSASLPIYSSLTSHPPRTGLVNKTLPAAYDDGKLSMINCMSSPSMGIHAPSLKSRHGYCLYRPMTRL